MNTEIKMISTDNINKMKKLARIVISMKSRLTSISNYENFNLVKEEILKHIYNFENYFKSVLDSIIFINEQNYEYRQLIEMLENRLKAKATLSPTPFVQNKMKYHQPTINYISKYQPLSFDSNEKQYNEDKYKPKEEIQYKSYKDISTMLNFDYDNYKGVHFEEKKIEYKPKTVINTRKEIQENIPEKKTELKKDITVIPQQPIIENKMKKENSNATLPINNSINNVTQFDNFSLSSFDPPSKTDTLLTKDKVIINPPSQTIESKEPEEHQILEEKIMNDIKEEEPKQKKEESKVERVQKIVLAAYQNEELLNRLKLKFGDNFDQAITSSEISDELLTKIEEEIANVSYEQVPHQLSD